MDQHVGPDVLLKSTAICVVDSKGKVMREGFVGTDPETIANFIALHAPHTMRIGLETGATSTLALDRVEAAGTPSHLYRCQTCQGLEDADQQGDRNDAIGIAPLHTSPPA
jgi:transposase